MGDLIGHWPLAGDAGNRAAADLQSIPADIEFGHAGPDGKPETAAAFNGRSSCIEIADHPALDLGQDDFSITAWVNSDADRHDVAGSILSKYDPELRRGMHLYIATNDGVTSAALANARQLSFGIDDARADHTWADCGRPGNAVKIDTLSVVNEELYAGTLEIGADECGHLWRYAGGQDWVDLGNPVGCNVVRCLVEFNGELYCATGRYALAGSCLGEILNTTPGGQVFRLTAEGEWIYCGHPGEAVGLPDDMDTGEYNFGKADDATSLQVWNGSLYVVSNHIKGVWRYDGGTEWTCVGPDSRVLSLTVYRGALYALGNGGPIYRCDDGNEWTDCGTPEGSTQNYGAATVRGELYVGTWPGAEVFRYAGDNNWQGFGRVGYEMEVMAMTMYNGKLYVGSLPMAHAWRMEETGDNRQFDVIANLDETPVKLRRLWSMAIHDGRLYAGTLPGGRVFAFEAGKMATWDRRFPGGWHHLAAVKRGGSLELYVDGVLQASSTPFQPGDFNLGNTRPLTIGFGADTYFAGMMSDVRLYRGALDHGLIGELCGNREG